MVIEISNMKYQPGCGKGIDKLEKPNLLAKINAIIDWESSQFPPKQKVSGDDSEWIEDREFLGPDPELKPGNVFKYGNQLLAIENKDSIVLVMSETGPYGLRRVWDEKISPEFNIVFDSPETDHADYEDATGFEIPEDWKTINPGYETMKLLRDRMLSARPDMFKEKGTVVKAKIHSPILFVPAEIYITDWNFRYDPAGLEDDEAEYLKKELLSLLYNDFKPKKGAYVNPYEKRNEAYKKAKEITSDFMDQFKKEIVDNPSDKDNDDSEDEKETSD